MPSDEAAEYYLTRNRASIAMSKAASEPAIRNIHLELARCYAGLALKSEKQAVNCSILSIGNGDV